MEMNQARLTLEELNIDKSVHEKNNKVMQNDINEVSSRMDDLQQSMNDADIQKKKLLAEKEDLQKNILDGESQMRNLGKMKTSLTTQLDDMKRLADAEIRDKAMLLGKFRNLETDLEGLKEKIEEETCAKGEIQKNFSRAISEAQIWKSKYNTEALSRIEDLENAKAKLMARISEAEECIDGLNVKVHSTEKVKNRYQIDLEDLQMEYERVNAAVAVAEKKLKNFDAIIGEWKLKCDDISNELDASQRECRNYNSELFRLKAAWDECIDNMDAVRRENKNLADEIKDLLDQLGEGGKSIHELDKQRRRLQVEKDELQAALEEAESALEQEENKAVRATLELQQVRQEIDRRLQEKEEEFESTRKNFQRMIDSMNASLEAEVKAKQEVLRIKKKIESDINELEMTLDHTNKANSEELKSIKRYATNLMELDTAVQEEMRSRNEIEDLVGTSERKGNALAGELDEAQMLLDTAERARKVAENEVWEYRDTINTLTTANASLSADKRHMDGTLRGLQQELDDLLLGVKNSEDKCKKAVTDAGRLADELRTEQEHGLSADRTAKAMFAQCQELQTRLNDAEALALRHGRKMITKLEEKIRMLRDELGSSQIRSSETHKAAVRADRKIREMELGSEEDKKNIDRMGELVEKLQGKSRTFKRQIEDAEEIAALNLAKFRKAQQQLEEAEERSSTAENHIGRTRAERGSSLPHYNGI